MASACAIASATAAAVVVVDEELRRGLDWLGWAPPFIPGQPMATCNVPLPRNRHATRRAPRNPALGRRARAPPDPSPTRPRARAARHWRAADGSSLQGENQQIAEQKCLFGNRQTKADLLVRLLGQQSPNRMPFCSPIVLTSLEGEPCTCQALMSVTSPIRCLTKNQERWHLYTHLNIQLSTNACSHHQKHPQVW